MNSILKSLLTIVTIALLSNISFANETICDIADTDEDHCAVCACYLENDIRSHEADLLITIQSMQAQASHPNFPNTICKAVT